MGESRLEPDGPCGQTVTQIASWAYYDSLGTDSIADLLNQDLAKFPPPTPPEKERARGSWCSSSVNDILRNPKYTGYQVYNRRATRSRRAGSRATRPEVDVRRAHGSSEGQATVPGRQRTELAPPDAPDVHLPRDDLLPMQSPHGR
ncbi:recombinase family protein [Amycolatopsis sp. WQ 127309]|uniref:recombinase family protein n=1 Tax=Amycolatopsis sp. WQ 127309 TaxID=2932773 RepID=UPI001FF60EBE|nr:recombinase family protein [Amycolatopsis sp. WQ 127309]UOZ06025.1 recombinase family protein [Amycolatopsis sp. WQ 127309]